MNFLNEWFQLTAIPSNSIQGYYEPKLVILSYVVAVLASFVALTLVGRLQEAEKKLSRIYWLVGGAFTMGAGIWSMHFIGMLAFIMPMPMAYEYSWTLASLIMAMLASGFALYILQKKNYSWYHLGLGGMVIGLGISTMHYMGMEGMRVHVDIHYLPSLFFLSILIGIIAAEIALYLALQSNLGSTRRQSRVKIISALIMGVAICGMHYMGMYASVFTPKVDHLPMEVQVIQPNLLAFFIAGISALIISLALLASSYYKKMINLVQNEREFLNAMLDNLEDGIIACDAQGNITVLNHTLKKYIDFNKNNKNIDDLYPHYHLYTLKDKPLKKEEYPIYRALNGEVIHGLELIIKFKNGQTIEVVVDGQPIINSEGNSLGAVTVIHDVTELKHTEKLKSEFVSIVSHELRTPLTSIRGSLGLLVSGVMGQFSEKSNNLLKIANNNCERLLLLINDILDIEKIAAGKIDFNLKNITLNTLIPEAIDANKMYADKYDISLEWIEPKENLTVHADSGRLMQVLANLISNACKFSPKNEHVTIDAQRIEDNVRVSVTDYGDGIPLEFQPRIFQKFSQADSSDTRGKAGTGLGLNISKSIIEKLGGKLNFHSSPGKGATFYFDLPLVLDHTENEMNPLEPSSKRRLLICEDDEDQANYIKALLESAGFHVDLAITAAQAREKLNTHAYHALLLDLILPDQDGITFIRDLRANQQTRDLPILVLSVISQTGKTLLNGDAVSVMDWFDKPVNWKQLLSTINRIKKQDSESKPCILHIEDNKDTQQVTSLLLENYAIVYTADNLKQAKEMLDQRKYDLIILDLLLPDGNGVEILPQLSRYKTPVLVFSDMELNNEYARYVSQALVKSNSSNEILLNTIINLM